MAKDQMTPVDPPQTDPLDAVALTENPDKLRRQIRDILQLSRATDSYFDSGRIISEAAIPNVDYDQRFDFEGEFPYILIPAQSRVLKLYANDSIFPFLIAPANTIVTAVFPRLRTLRVVAPQTTNADVIRIETSSREYKVPYLSAGDTLSDAEPNPTVSPVGAYMMGWDGTVWRRVRVTSTATPGAVLTANGLSGNDAAPTAALALDSVGTSRPLGVLGYQWNGTSSDRQRTPTTFKSVSTAAAGSTALWTPAAGKKFRVMAFKIDVTQNAAQAVAGINVIDLLDAAAAVGFAHSVFVPAAAAATFGPGFTSGWITLGNGYLSAAANQTLNLNLGTALTAGTVRALAIGTEE